MAAEGREPSVDNVQKTILFLKKLTPHAVGAARSLASEGKRDHWCFVSESNLIDCHLSLSLPPPAEPGSAMLDHFNHLRRQWASKGQSLLANLRAVTSADMQGVLGELVAKERAAAAF